MKESRRADFLKRSIVHHFGENVEFEETKDELVITLFPQQRLEVKFFRSLSDLIVSWKFKDVQAYTHEGKIEVILRWDLVNKPTIF